MQAIHEIKLQKMLKLQKKKWKFAKIIKQNFVKNVKT